MSGNQTTARSHSDTGLVIPFSSGTTWQTNVPITPSVEYGPISVEISKESQVSTVSIQVPLVRYRIRSLVFSTSALTTGLFDILMFIFKGEYFIHPSVDLILIVAGFFLFLTTILAIKGK